MHIQLTTITQTSQQRQFCLYSDELELVFELIHIATQQGEAIADISFFDQKGALHIPIEALRSPYRVNPFLQIKQQWKLILALSTGAESTKIELSGRQYGYLTSTRQKQLCHFQRVQEQLQQLVETTQMRLADGPRKKRLIAIHQRSLQRCQQSIAQLSAFL